ncbi:MAG: hypothetical protein WBA48_03915, partial [Xanthobacteraceae bacterium]
MSKAGPGRGREFTGSTRHRSTFGATERATNRKTDVAVPLKVRNLMSVTEVNDRSTALVATSTSKATPDLLARAFLDILARASGDDSKSMLRSGDPDDPIEKLLDDLSSVSSR